MHVKFKQEKIIHQKLLWPTHVRKRCIYSIMKIINWRASHRHRLQPGQYCLWTEKAIDLGSGKRKICGWCTGECTRGKEDVETVAGIAISYWLFHQTCTGIAPELHWDILFSATPVQPQCNYARENRLIEPIKHY